MWNSFASLSYQTVIFGIYAVGSLLRFEDYPPAMLFEDLFKKYIAQINLPYPSDLVNQETHGYLSTKIYVQDTRLLLFFQIIPCFVTK